MGRGGGNGGRVRCVAKFREKPGIEKLPKNDYYYLLLRPNKCVTQVIPIKNFLPKPPIKPNDQEASSNELSHRPISAPLPIISTLLLIANNRSQIETIAFNCNREWAESDFSHSSSARNFRHVTARFMTAWRLFKEIPLCRLS